MIRIALILKDSGGEIRLFYSLFAKTEVVSGLRSTSLRLRNIVSQVAQRIRECNIRHQAEGSFIPILSNQLEF